MTFRKHHEEMRVRLDDEELEQITEFAFLLITEDGHCKKT